MRYGIIGVMVAGLLACAAAGKAAETKGDRSFQATVADTQGVETELKNVMFYWEEKVSETSFVPHELRYLPVKRGTSNVSRTTRAARSSASSTSP